jgi:hypothetical protein
VKGIRLHKEQLRGPDLNRPHPPGGMLVISQPVTDEQIRETQLQASASDTADGSFIFVPAAPGVAMDVTNTFWEMPLADQDGTSLGHLLLYVADVEQDRMQNASAKHRNNDDVWLYTVYYLNPLTHQWLSLCPMDKFGKPHALAMPVNPLDRGRDSRRNLTFACTASGVAAKCARNWGYKPWRQTAGGIDWQALYGGCLAAARADYCQDDRSFTRNGTLVDLFDGKVVLSDGWAYAPGSTGTMLHEEYQISIEKSVRTLIGEPAFSQLPDDATRILVTRLKGSGLQSSRYGDLDPGRSDASADGQRCAAAPFINRCAPHEPYACYRSNNQADNFGALVAINSPRHCAHSDGEVGEPLDPLCNACVTRVCSVRPSCCGDRAGANVADSLVWDKTCVELRDQVCRSQPPDPDPAKARQQVWPPGVSALPPVGSARVFRGGIIGSFEGFAAGNVIEGWACDPGNPQASIPIQVALDQPLWTPGTRVLAATVADQPLRRGWRELVAQECSGDPNAPGRHGFRITLDEAQAGGPIADRPIFVYGYDVSPSASPLARLRGGSKRTPAAGADSPTVTLPANNVSVLWTGWVEPEAPGNYRFVPETTGSGPVDAGAEPDAAAPIDAGAPATGDDDEYRVWVNGWLVAKRWDATDTETVRPHVYLLRGVRYHVRVEYRAGTGAPKFKLEWADENGQRPIPTTALYPLAQGSGTGAEIEFFADPRHVADQGSGKAIASEEGECQPGAAVDCIWQKTPAPEGEPDDPAYGVRVRGQVVPPVTGTYLFRAESDGATEIFVDGRLVGSGATHPRPDDATCGHDVCEVGGALNRACGGQGGCAGFVCLRDPYCCALTWDSTCVGRVQQACGFACTPPPAEIELRAGVKYDVEVRYRHAEGTAGKLRLLWATPGSAADTIPAHRFFKHRVAPPSGTGINVTYFSDRLFTQKLLDRTDAMVEVDPAENPGQSPTVALVCLTGGADCGQVNEPLARPLVSSPPAGIHIGERVTFTGGGLTAGAHIRIFEGTALVADKAAEPDGTFSVQVDLSPGRHNLRFQQVHLDLATTLWSENSACSDTDRCFELNVFPAGVPGAPTVAGGAVAPVSGQRVEVKGTGTAGATVTATGPGGIVTTTVGSDGSYTMVVPLPFGTHPVTLTQTLPGSTNAGPATTVDLSREVPQVVLLHHELGTPVGDACDPANSRMVPLTVRGTAQPGLGPVKVADGDGRHFGAGAYFMEIAQLDVDQTTGEFSGTVNLDHGRHLLKFFQRATTGTGPNQKTLDGAYPTPLEVAVKPPAALAITQVGPSPGLAYVVDTPVFLAGTSCLTRRGLRNTAVLYEGGVEERRAPIMDGGRFEMPAVELTPGCQELTASEAALSLSGAGEVLSDRTTPPIVIAVRPPPPVIESPDNGDQIRALTATVSGTRRPGARVTFYRNVPADVDPERLPEFAVGEVSAAEGNSAIFSFTMTFPAPGHYVLQARQTIDCSTTVNAESHLSAPVSLAVGDMTPPTVQVAESGQQAAPGGALVAYTVQVSDDGPSLTCTRENPTTPGASSRFVCPPRDSDSETVTVTCTPGFNSLFLLGATDISCEAREGDGGPPGFGTRRVFVTNPRGPRIHAPDIEVEAQGPAGAAVNYQVTATGWVANCAPPGSTELRPCARWGPADQGLGFVPRAIAQDPSNPDTLFVATSEALGPSRLLRSIDGGGTWEVRSALPSGWTPRDLVILAGGGQDTRTLFLGTSRGVLKSTDSGHIFNVSSEGLDTRDLMVDAAGTLYAAAANGVHRATSDAAGATEWSSFGLEGRSVISLANDPQRPGRLYAGVGSFEGASEVSGPQHVVFAKDTATTWRLLDTPADALTVAIPPRFLAVSPVDSTLYTPVVKFTFTESGAVDDATFWSREELGLSEASAEVGSVAFGAGDTVYAGARGVVQRTGGIWPPINQDLWVARPTRLLVGSGSRLYALGSSGLYASDESAPAGSGVRQWERVTPGRAGGSSGEMLPLGDYSLTAVLPDPTTPNRAYAATTAGLFKTTNAGATWFAQGTGLVDLAASPGGGLLRRGDEGFIGIRDLAMDAGSADVLYANSGPRLLFLSNRNGDEWAHIQGPAVTAGAGAAMAGDPFVPGRVYVANDLGKVWRRERPVGVGLGVDRAFIQFGEVARGRTQQARVQVRNQGAALLNITQVGLENGTDFMIPTHTCTALPPGQTCDVDVAYRPISGSAPHASAVLRVTGFVPGGQAVSVHTALAGRAGSPFAIDRDLLTFVEPVGSPGTARTLTVTNRSDLSVGPPFVTVTNPRFVIVTNGCIPAVPPGQSCAISVRFVASDTQPQVGSLRLQTTAPDPGLDVALHGQALAPARIEFVAPSDRNFGTVAPGQITPPLSFRIRNAGDQPALGPFTVNRAGVNPLAFLADGTNCPGSLAPGQTCDAFIRFAAPMSSGTTSAVATVTAATGGTAGPVNLSGESLAPGLAISPAVHDFGDISPSGPQPSFTITVTNMDAATVLTQTPFVTGLGFVVNSSTCGGPLAAASSCAITVSPAPVGGGSSVLTSTVAVFAGPRTVVASLAARTRAAVARLEPVVGGLDFGSVGVGQGSRPRRLAISNVGNQSFAPLTCQALGAGAASFRLMANSCAGQALAPGASCGVDLVFAPDGPGPRAATFECGVRDVALAGVGLAPAGILTDVGATTFAGLQPTGTESFPLMFRISAVGPPELRTGPLTLAIGGDNADDFRLEPAGCGAARTEGLPSGQFCVGFIFFAPQTAGDRRAQFTFGSAGAGSSIRTLAGTAVGPSTAAVWLVSAGSEPPPAGVAIAGVEGLLVLPSEPRLIATRFLLGGGADTYFYPEGVSAYLSLDSGPNHVLADTTAQPFAFYGKPAGGPPTALQRREDLGTSGTWEVRRTAAASGHPREGNFARLVTDPALAGPVLYTLGTGGQLWTSADGGRNWQRFEPQPPEIAFARLWMSPADGSLYAQAVPAAAFPGPHGQDATAPDQGPWATPGEADLVGGRLWRHNPTGPLPAGARVVEGDLRPTCTGGPAGSHRGAVFPLDPPVTEIDCTATDAFQTTATARFRVTVTDRTPPAVTVPPDVVVDGTGPVTVVYSPPPSAEDLVDGPMTPDCVDAVTGAPRPSGSLFQGSTAVICRATDNHGNTGQASFKVTAGAAGATVTLTVPSDRTGADAVAADDAAGADFVYPTSAIVSDGSPAVITCTPAGTHFPLGITTVSCVATGAGAADAKSFRIEVRDRTAPVVQIPTDKKQLQAVAASPLGAEVSFDLPAATDNVEPLVSVACSPGAGLYPIGTTEVTCSAVDRAGNVGSNTFQITVSDLSPPTLTLPADIREEADSRFGKRVSYAVSASDDETPGGLRPTCVPASGTLFPLNTTVTVTCIARDSSANQVSGSFRVTVFDGEPSVTVPQAAVVAEAIGPEGGRAEFKAEAFDSIDGAIEPACTRTAVSGSDLPVAVKSGENEPYPLGLSEVTCQATDSSGNQASASFVVEVRDTTPPTLTFTTNSVLAPAQSAAGAVVDFTSVVSATDLVNGVGLPIDCKPASGTTFPLGVTDVTCRARDQADNLAEGQLRVEVADGTAPVVRVPADITVPADGPAGSVVDFAHRVSATDEVEGVLDATCTPTSGATFPVGVTTVTCTATDKQHRTGTGSFRITVTKPPSGNRAPVITEVTGPKDPLEVASTVKLAASYTDADTADRHTCSIKWEDGTVKTGTVTESKGKGTCKGERKLNTTGVLATTVTITDNRGLVASARHEFTVLYKDSGRFVVAAGTAASPAGALRAEPTATGTARFGLLAPFHFGARTPNAGSRLRFAFADLQLDAGDFQRMFIQDHTAIYFGQGKVNGTAGFAFAAAVREGRRREPDRFGIVIWNPRTGAVIYSNLPDGARDPDPDRLPPLATGEVIIED